MQPDPKTIEAVFALALEQPTGAARSAYLDRACSRDSILRQRVEALLAAHAAAGSFLQQPVLKRDERSQVETLAPEDTGAVAPAPGTLVRYLGDYELLEEIARGGMGVVYKARQRSLDRIVALKMILAGQFASRDEVERFYHEARTAAGLRHPNLVSIHEVGEHQGHHFFTMDYVDGPSLADVVRDHPLAPREAAELMRTVAEAIQAAHEYGTLHRDLKPSNVLLDRAGRPHVTDFGLAKLLAHPDVASAGAGRTATGAVIGTPSYMPPEQASGRHGQLGPASDVYSLGAVLYELVTGRPPFRAATPMDTLLQVLETDPAPPRLLNPSVPRDLETILLKCLAREPERRYPTARALGDDLQAFLDGRPIQARRPMKIEIALKWARRRPAAAALIGVSAAAATLLLLGTLVFNAHLQRLRRDVEDEQTQTLTAQTEADAERQAARTANRQAREHLGELRVAEGWRRLHDDKWGDALLLFAEAARADTDDAARQRTHRIRFRAVAQHFPRLLQVLPTGALISHAAFSPDSTRLVTAGHDGFARIWDVATGQQLHALVAGERFLFIAEFSPDGNLLATASGDDTARLFDVASGSQRALLRHPGRVHGAAFNPKGDLLATACEDGQARIWDVATGQLRRELKHAARVDYVRFSPDGRMLLAYHPGATVRIGEDPPGEARIWETTSGKLLADLPRESANAFRDLVISPDGKTMASACGFGIRASGEVRFWDVATGKVTGPTLEHSQEAQSVAFSPDGLRVASGSNDQTARVWDPITGEPISPPLRHTDRVSLVSFGPDGGRLLTVTAHEVRLWDAETGKPLTAPLHHPAGIRHAEFSPDGRRMLVVSGQEVRVWEAATGYARLWQEADRPVPPASPEKYVLERHGNAIHVLDKATGKPACPPLEHAEPVHQFWGPEGHNVVTWSGFMSNSRLHIWDIAAGKQVGPAVAQDDAALLGVAVSPDGRRALAWTSNRVRVWDPATGAVRGPDLQPVESIIQAALSPGGEYVMTASLEDTVRVWDVVSGQPVTPALYAFVSSLGRFRSDGKALLIPHIIEKQVEEWDFIPDDRSAEELVRLARLLSCRRLDPTAGLVAVPAAELRREYVALRERDPGAFTISDKKELLEWHRHMAGGVTSRQSVALWHLERLLALAPEDGEALGGRGCIHAELGHWDQALADLERAVALNVNEWHNLALLRLRSGDMTGYRKSCAEMVRRYTPAEATSGPTGGNPYPYLETCVLGPDAVADFGPLLKQARKAVAGLSPQEVSYRDRLGAVLYRAAKYEEAARTLTELQRQLKDTDWFTAADCAFLAMAEHHLGHAPEARQWLEQARRWLDRAARQPPKKDLSSTGYAAYRNWARRLEFQLLIAEASKLIEAPSR